MNKKFLFDGGKLLILCLCCSLLGACGTYMSVTQVTQQGKQTVPVNLDKTPGIDRYRASIYPDYLAWMVLDSAFVGFKVDERIEYPDPTKNSPGYYYVVTVYHSHNDTLFKSYADSVNLEWQLKDY
jgi:hypothetical protein